MPDRPFWKRPPNLVGAVALWGYWMSVALHGQSDNREMINQLLGGAGYAQGVAVPSHWMTRGLQTAGEGFLLTSPQVRPFVRSIVERFRPQTVVMSQNEVHASVRLRTLGTV